MPARMYTKGRIGRPRLVPYEQHDEAGGDAGGAEGLWVLPLDAMKGRGPGCRCGMPVIADLMAVFVFSMAVRGSLWQHRHRPSRQARPQAHWLRPGGRPRWLTHVTSAGRLYRLCMDICGTVQ